MAATPSDPRTRSWYRSPLTGKSATHGIYIEIVVLALILALEEKGATDGTILVTVFGALFALVLAEFYAYYVGTMIGAGRAPSREELRATALGTGASLLAVIPPVLLVMLGVAGLIGLQTGFSAAKWTGVTVLGLYALLATRRAGLSIHKSLATAAVFAALGFGLVLLKELFH